MLGNFNKETIIVCKLKGTKTQNGYRQLGIIGNFVSTHSYGECRQLQHFSGGYEYLQEAYARCMEANAKMLQQNIIALTAKVLELTKLNKVFEKR